MFSVKPSMGFIEIIRPENLIYLAGLLLFARWLLKTSFGARALADAPPRRNNMGVYLPLIPLFIWFGPIPMAVLVAEQLTQHELRNWQIAFLDNCVLAAGAVVTIVVILFLARAHFARRLKGFGLNAKTIVRDIFGAFVNLLAVWPLIAAAILVIRFLGRHIWGKGYQMPEHQELQLISHYSQLPLRIVIVIVAVVVAPPLEEMLFRGLLQTMLRSMLENARLRTAAAAWLAIAMVSGLFAMMHANASHWPALFILSMCMGYTYEKSGSLFRSIFIHALFNGLSVAAALSQT
jgi:membrane protease YdiL (CAAX protease family)